LVRDRKGSQNEAITISIQAERTVARTIDDSKEAVYRPLAENAPGGGGYIIGLGFTRAKVVWVLPRPEPDPDLDRTRTGDS